MLVSAAPVPGLGWTVTAAMPSATALAPADTFQRTLGISLGVALFLVLAFTALAWRFVRHRAAEQAAAQYARSLIEAGLDPLVTISPEGEIADVNEATIKVTGVPREELIGTDFSDYFTEPDQAKEGYRLAFEQGSVTDYPLTMRHRDGTLTEVLYNAAVYRDSGGKVLGLFAAARDVTETKLAQAELAKQAKELDRLADLERFQRLAIGRELKMIALKREMEYLKQFAPAEGEESREEY
ncbi:MAG: PAS domain S-box protein [Phycicoccus sp.]|nr:PAS domain S-box protein [Phycicoccus sp.]NMM33247.1 PAS domain S-box protein [Phycicoccus sp.]